MRRVFVDADILIWHLRFNPRGTAFLLWLMTLPDTMLCISAAQRIEILFHARPDEFAATDEVLSNFETIPVTADIVDEGALLYRRWHPSHGTGAYDAILAATVIQARGKLYTQNIRHFPMPELDVELGWE